MSNGLNKEMKEEFVTFKKKEERNKRNRRKGSTSNGLKKQI